MATKPFIWSRGGRATSPDAVQRERDIAALLLKGGIDTSPVQHWTQGLARMAQTAAGVVRENRADEAQRAGTQGWMQQLAPLLSGGGGAPVQDMAASSTAMPGAGGVDPGMVQALAGDMGSFGNAISSIESGGRYDALGPITRTGDRAYGKFQIMGANVGPWTREILGREMTPQEFLANPEAQEAVFRGKFGQYAQRHGPEGAARAWFAGEGGMNDPNRRDQLGTSVAAYADRFNRSLGGQPTQVASLDPSTGVAQALASQPGGQPAPAAGGDMQGIAQSLATVPASQPAPTNNRLSQLLAASASPWAPKGASGILGALVQSELKQQAQQRQSQQDLQRRQGAAQSAGIDPRFAADPELWKGAVGQQFRAPPSSVGEYGFYEQQEHAAGRQPLPYGEWDQQRRRSSATNVSLNTVEGLQEAQTKARIAIDTENAKEIGKQALAGQRLVPLLDQVERLADKTPGGWAGPVAASLSRAYAAAGWEVPEGWSNAELLQSISQRLIPIVREPGPTSERELGIYLRAVPGLMQSPEGRRKVVRMTRSIIERSNAIAKVYRQHVGSPELYDRLAEMDKPIFSEADRRELEGGAAPNVDDVLKKYGD